MIYLLITTSLIERNFEERKRRYLNGITIALRRFKDLNCKIIILENNGSRSTFLDDFGVDVFYTNSNQLATNIGNKELVDLRKCIEHYAIQDEDFIVKLSGRYIIQEQSEFMEALQLYRDTKDTILLYGYFYGPQYKRVRDCVTGLIGMKCKHLKRIQPVAFNDCIEWHWADVALSIPEEQEHKVRTLGVAVCPGLDPYTII
jgi:hypothetical protein